MMLPIDFSDDFYLQHRESEGYDNPCSHISTDEASICRSSVSVSDEKSLIPLDEISLEEWSSLLDRSSNFCSHCRKRVITTEIVPERFREQSEIQDQIQEIPDDEVRPPVDGVHIDYRMGPTIEPSPSDHIVDGGFSLCNYRIKVGQAKSLKPIENVSLEEWALLLGENSNLCSGCLEAAMEKDLLPKSVPIEPKFGCPYCEQPVEEIVRLRGTFVYHPDTIHKVTQEYYEQWRRNPNNDYPEEQH